MQKFLFLDSGDSALACTAEVPVHRCFRLSCGLGKLDQYEGCTALSYAMLVVWCMLLQTYRYPHCILDQFIYGMVQ